MPNITVTISGPDLLANNVIARLLEGQKSAGAGDVQAALYGASIVTETAKAETPSQPSGDTDIRVGDIVRFRAQIRPPVGAVGDTYRVEAITTQKPPFVEPGRYYVGLAGKGAHIWRRVELFEKVTRPEFTTGSAVCLRNDAPTSVQRTFRFVLHIITGVFDLSSANEPARTKISLEGSPKLYPAEFFDLVDHSGHTFLSAGTPVAWPTPVPGKTGFASNLTPIPEQEKPKPPIVNVDVFLNAVRVIQERTRELAALIGGDSATAITDENDFVRRQAVTLDPGLAQPPT